MMGFYFFIAGLLAVVFLTSLFDVFSPGKNIDWDYLISFGGTCVLLAGYTAFLGVLSLRWKRQFSGEKVVAEIVNMKDVDLYQIGILQKNLMGLILCTFVSFMFPPIQLILNVFSAYVIFKLIKSLKMTAVWVWTLFAYIPLIGLFVLLHINGKATQQLTARGIRVGLMGARKEDLEKLAQEG
jgi:hypothetical protein